MTEMPHVYVANNTYDPAAKADLKHTASPPGGTISRLSIPLSPHHLKLEATASLTTENKKVSYPKQIARQHSCHENFRPGQGRGRSGSNLRLIYFDQHAKFNY